MILTILRLLSLITGALRSRSDLALEYIALRQQLAILNRQLRWPKLRWSDRHFWLLLSRSWSCRKETLLIVKPETVLRWHKKRFASYWTRLSKKNRPGRPGKDREIRELIRKYVGMDTTLHKAMVGLREITANLHLKSIAEHFTPARGTKNV